MMGLFRTRSGPNGSSLKVDVPGAVGLSLRVVCCSNPTKLTACSLECELQDAGALISKVRLLPAPYRSLRDFGRNRSACRLNLPRT